MSCRLSPPRLGPMLSQCYFPEDFAKVNMQDSTLKSTEAQSSRVESSSPDTKDPLSDWFWLLPEPVTPSCPWIQESLQRLSKVSPTPDFS